MSIFTLKELITTNEPISKIKDAIKSGDFNIDGDDVKNGHSKEKTPLLWAIEKHREDVIKLLLKHGADVNITCTSRGFNACIRNVYAQNTKVMLEIIKKTKDLDYKQPSTGRSALLLACSNGYDDTALELVKAGADVDSYDNNGYTVLMECVTSGCDKTFEYILKYKDPDLNLKTKKGTLWQNLGSNTTFIKMLSKYEELRKNKKKLGRFAKLMRD